MIETTGARADQALTLRPAGNFAPVPLQVWRTDMMEAFIDGARVVEVRDATYSRGLVGITSRFHPALFDDLSVDAAVAR